AAPARWGSATYLPRGGGVDKVGGRQSTGPQRNPYCPEQYAAWRVDSPRHLGHAALPPQICNEGPQVRARPSLVASPPTPVADIDGDGLACVPSAAPRRRVRVLPTSSTVTCAATLYIHVRLVVGQPAV